MRFIFGKNISALVMVALCNRADHYIFALLFWFSLDYFVPGLFAFVVLGLVSSVLRQEIVWE